MFESSAGAGLTSDIIINVVKTSPNDTIKVQLSFVSGVGEPWIPCEASRIKKCAKHLFLVKLLF